MTVVDLLDVLEHLRVPGGHTTTVRIDRGVRDYLVRMLKGPMPMTDEAKPKLVPPLNCRMATGEGIVIGAFQVRAQDRSMETRSARLGSCC